MSLTDPTEGRTIPPTARDAAVMLAAKAHDRLDRIEQRHWRLAAALVVAALIIGLAAGDIGEHLRLLP